MSRLQKILILAFCFAVAFGGAAGAETPKGELVVAQQYDAETMDPQKQGKMPDMNILINVFDTLVTRDADNKLVPMLATEWTPVNDTTWRFKLRQGVKFHDGEPFNAEAAKFSLDRLLDPATKSPIAELRHVKEVKIVDDYTIDIVTNAPDPIMPNRMIMFGGVMVPPKYIREKGDEEFARAPVGTGPFKFVSWKKDSQVVLEANDDYWRGRPKIDRLVFRVLPNIAEMAAALRVGEIDISSPLPYDVVKQIQDNDGLQVVHTPSIRIYYLPIDTTREGPTSKKEVRQALNYAVDVQGIIDALYGGHGVRAKTLIPMQNFGYDASIPSYTYDPEKAKRLLAAAGYPNGFDITLDADSAFADVVNIIAAQFEEIGVHTTVNLMDARTLTANVTAKKMSPIYLMGNTGWTLDGLSNFQSYVKSDRRYNHWKNERADQLVNVEEQTLDPQKRQEAFSEAQKLLIDEAPYVYLFQADNFYGMRKDVHWQPNIIGLMKMYDASKD